MSPVVWVAPAIRSSGHLKRRNPHFHFVLGPVNYVGTLGTYEIWSNYCQTDKYFIRCSDVADLGLFQIASQLLGKPCPYSSENTFLPAPKAVFHNCYVPVVFPCTQGRFVGLLAALPSTFRTLSAADLECGRHSVPPSFPVPAIFHFLSTIMENIFI